MQHLLGLALSFPAVVYTVLLGVSLVYWLLVLVGAARVELAGDGAADAVADGLADGAADHLDLGGHHAGADIDAGDVADGHGGLSGMLAALKLRSAPATVVLGCLALFSWIFAMIGVQVAESWDSTLARVGVFVLAPLLALFPTSLAVRPLARFFVPPEELRHKHLVGKLCTIRTGHVDERFGEATLEDGGAGLVVRVRIDGGESLKRGDQAVIVDYDEAKQEFTVAPMNDLLAAREDAKK